ncbi:hypothetical protein SDC9_84672 [bioreactor metagenome]|uniref:Uncharacterized protein n=1 Tax=bioreactor metagenome TaxID=1076179 RepID=A0A644ZBF3_9ZZZZ
MLVMMPLMQTDFPLPVAPAISRWGIFVRFALCTTPEISRPNGTSNSLSVCFWPSITSRKDTTLTSLFGTSMPMKDLPGIGASMRISFAAKAKARSSLRFTILLTFTPTAGWISYFVTAGPRFAFVTLASTPKLANVSSSFLTFFSIVAYSFD